MLSAFMAASAFAKSNQLCPFKLHSFSSFRIGFSLILVNICCRYGSSKTIVSVDSALNLLSVWEPKVNAHVRVGKRSIQSENSNRNIHTDG